MKKILVAAAFFTFCFINAQTSGQLANNQMSAGGANNDAVSYLLGDIKSGNEKRKIEENDIQGSAYTSETFLPGKLYYKDKLEGDVFYRYNAYMEEIEIKNVDFPGAPVRGLQRDKNIRVLTPEGKSLSFETFIDKKGLTQNGYLQELSRGKYTLYKRSDVKYTQPMKSQNSFVPAQPARFSKFVEYYIQLEGRNRIDELELKKSKLLKLVAESDREALKAHMKERRLSVKNENDILSILVFLNK
ncbi:hypothetical protein [Croceivirga thetidis]|uniref:Uncharacterized protein n=1 Tax=Croceivirga thetidis TaxID=2721623 RepID=A0ABX1GTH9_9FLAO|nr:hypothetical protein [Croceivirga thetidis]NKI33238.1 hypothetical protein [Croceivirga thetidis]